MDQGNTHEFVEKLQQNQENQRKNKQRQGDNMPSRKLPNKKH